MTVELLVKGLGLGTILEEPTNLKGGELHTMFRVRTQSCDLAIKQINPHITKKVDFKKNYEISEEIAALFSDIQIPAIKSLKFNGEHVLKVGKEYFMVYPFIEGHILEDTELKREHANLIGQIYASMHCARLEILGVDKPHMDYFSNQHWQNIILNSNNKALDGLLSTILKWNRIYSDFIPVLAKEVVVTHRDMHRQNVLWDQQNKPHILDWESAGLMNPLMELIGYGLEWGGIISNHALSTDLFQTMLKSYLKNGSTHWNTLPRAAFFGWLGHCVLAWTEFNIQRMNGVISDESSEIDRGKNIIGKTMIPCLEYIRENEKELLLLIESTFKPKLPY